MTPANPPPRVAPRYIPNMNAVCAETLASFTGCYICVWMKDRRRIWLCPTSVSTFSVAGYVWRGGAWAQSRLNIGAIAGFY